MEQKFFNFIDMNDLEFNLKIAKQPRTNHAPTDEKIIFTTKLKFDEVWSQPATVLFPECLIHKVDFEAFTKDLTVLI